MSHWMKSKDTQACSTRSGSRSMTTAGKGDGSSYSSTIAPRDLRSLSEFVLEQEARVGIVIHNDTVPRQYEEKIIGVPFTHL